MTDSFRPGSPAQHLTSKTPADRIAAAAENNGFAVAMLSRDVEEVRAALVASTLAAIARDAASTAKIDKLTISVDALSDAFKAAKFTVSVLKGLATAVAGLLALWAALVHSGKAG
jgi:hypothetical protein